MTRALINYATQHVHEVHLIEPMLIDQLEDTEAVRLFQTLQRRLWCPMWRTLPPRLVDTADSLVALSRQRAPTLKRDEEIARAHACAEIACGRLLEKLRLPPVKTGSAPANIHVLTNDPSEAPSFVLPFVRALCAHFRTPSMAHHAYIGCIRNVKGLVMAVWMMVLTRMMKGRMEKALFHNVTARMVRVAGWTTMETAADDQGAKKREKEVEGWVKKVDQSGWTRGQEWWEEVPMGCWEFSLQDGDGQLDGGVAAEEGQEEEMGDSDNDELGEEEKGRREDLNLDPDPEGVLLPGLGTMMQDAVDWLSDERTRQFKVWKADTLQKIEQILT
ncbi:hypothetical protein DV737_g4733, partial [Chaetothyriales sp. CBS 132003]